MYSYCVSGTLTWEGGRGHLQGKLLLVGEASPAHTTLDELDPGIPGIASIIYDRQLCSLSEFILRMAT